MSNTGCTHNFVHKKIHGAPLNQSEKLKEGHEGTTSRISISYVDSLMLFQPSKITSVDGSYTSFTMIYLQVKSSSDYPTETMHPAYKVNRRMAFKEKQKKKIKKLG